MEIVSNLFTALAATVLIFIGSRFWKWLRVRLITAAPQAGEPSSEAGHAGPTLRPLPLPEDLSIVDKVVYLERKREEEAARLRSARSRGEEGAAEARRHKEIQECLNSMAFLEEGDVLADEYRLLAMIGGGRTSVVWKAYAQRQDRFVAIKFLRHLYLNDESIQRQFHYTARVMVELSAQSIAAVREEVRQLKVDGSRKVVYYVLEYVEGETLDIYAARHPERRAQLVDGLLEVGKCIADAHARGIVHRDLKPGNIIVEPTGRLKLVDFDSVLRLGDRRICHHDVGTFGYSAPEVLEGAIDPDVRADIFALGRVFSYLFYGRSLPNAYALSVYDVIDLLNCAPVIKTTLERACAISPTERYATMAAFLAELREAIREDREESLPAIGTLRRERTKVGKVLRHSFYGTLAVMILARPVLAHFGAVQLSDKPEVGAFHAIIGSLVWGTFISGAFLIYLVLLGRRLRDSWTRYLAAAAFCGLGGLLGGFLVSVPSIFVTNPDTLTCLGWLRETETNKSATAVDPSARERLETALLQTRMLLAFPLTGLLTGIGLGLCLLRGIEMALRVNPMGNGLLPIPTKRSSADPAAGPGISGPLLTSLRAHLFLAFPALFFFLVVLVLHPTLPTPQDCAVHPSENARTFGEGLVHYLGAIGLTIGFFHGVRTGGRR